MVTEHTETTDVTNVGVQLLVGAVIVTYRRPEVVLETLRAVLAQTRIPDVVIVVDNDHDASLEKFIETVGPTVVHLRTGDNVGFSAALAAGIDQLTVSHSPAWFWLMDDDSPPVAGALESALSFATSPGVGVVANRGGHIRWGRIRHDLQSVGGTEVCDADFSLVDGAIVSSDAVRSVGLPRNDLFMMMEDVEYTTRIRRAGLRVVVRPSDGSVFYHLGTSTGSRWRGYYQSRNHLRIALDRRSIPWLFGWSVREAGYGVRLVQTRRWSDLALRWRGTLDALRNRMGRTIEPPVR